ncbi:MAG: 2-amino-4-hydroxy-6-hydroxymethyldihydropteridine diphosphokinase [Steroidobacteraceae bacterium]
MACWRPAYVALGSNLDGPRYQVGKALERLARLPDSQLVCYSALYSSAPFGPVEQPRFVNAVAALLTMTGSRELLSHLKDLELALGRDPAGQRWGPRRIDLDLLQLGVECANDDQLQLPHPGIVQRNFVLYPWAEIAPELWVPGVGRVADLARAISPAGLTRLD